MPTIEIVSINSNGLTVNQSEFDIAIIIESKLISHRGLFQTVLSQHKGTIIHLGNPDLKPDKTKGFFAGQIINWAKDSSGHFKFLDKYKKEIENILSASLDSSPDKHALFLTDYQFETDKAGIKTSSQKDFWKQHDTDGLRWNTLYDIKDKK